MKTKKAFTLVELLVVISIIALLMSILMPALAKVREQAKKVICASNLNQTGLAFALYGAYNDEYAAPKAKNFQPWDSALAPYFSTGEDDANKKYCRCPADKKPRKVDPAYSQFKYSISAVLPRSYSINAALENRGDLKYIVGGNGSWIPAKYTQVVRPVKTIHVMEFHLGYNELWSQISPSGSVGSFGNVQGSPAYQDWLKPSIPNIEIWGEIDQRGNMHKDGGNWLFVDGHVAWHKFNKYARRFEDQLYEDLEFSYNWQYGK